MLSLSEERLTMFAAAVAPLFPMAIDEDLDTYFARVRASDRSGALKISQVAKIATHLRSALREEAKAKRMQKTTWIQLARQQFSPGARSECAVCGGYDSLTQAHHVLPLELQYDLGIAFPVQEFEWVCPTHHAALHVIIDALTTGTEPELEGVPSDEQEALNKVTLRFVELWTAVPGWNR